MTQEDKQLVLIDLCGRLPYGVHLFTSSKCHIRLLTISNDIDYDEQFWINGLYDVDEVKPYLRLMSSMTEEEKEELRQEQIKDEQLFADCIKNHPEMRGLIIPHFAADWCDKNMFDYRGLIPKGIALVALEGMYKVKK